MTWAKRVVGGWLLAIHAQPGARRSGIAGMHGDALKVRVAAPPAEGRANDELVALVAEALGVPKNSVTVVKGGASRRKTVLVAAPQADPARLLSGESR
ncbi:MAG TPA: DUF167 domain-containing protein [Burkholderiales bacterium]